MYRNNPFGAGVMQPNFPLKSYIMGYDLNNARKGKSMKTKMAKFGAPGVKE